jgi:prolipoprotein diacylglyceryltransferase
MPELSASEHRKRIGWIESQGAKIAPAFKILILAIICLIAIGARVFSVIRYESVSFIAPILAPF